MDEETRQVSNEEKIANLEMATKRLEEANAKYQEILIKTEQAKLKDLLGGRADVNVPVVVESDKEYALRMLKGGA